MVAVGVDWASRGSSDLVEPPLTSQRFLYSLLTFHWVRGFYIHSNLYSPVNHHNPSCRRCSCTPLCICVCVCVCVCVSVSVSLSLSLNRDKICMLRTFVVCLCQGDKKKEEIRCHSGVVTLKQVLLLVVYLQSNKESREPGDRDVTLTLQTMHCETIKYFKSILWWLGEYDIVKL